MIAREDCAQIAQELRESPAVRRVLFCSHDGLPHYDDRALESRDAGAATVSALMGIAALAAEQFAIGAPQGVVVYGAAEQVIARAVDSDLVMVVIAEIGGPGQDVYRRVRAVARRAEREGALGVSGS